MTPSLKVCGLARALPALVIVFVVAATGPIFAKDANGAWAVKGRLVGKDGKKSKDVSGIACASDKGFPRACVVIDDELQAAQVVTVHDDKIKTDGERLIPLINDRFENAPVELDGEGVAFAGGYFYVIGSHGGPRNGDASEGEIEARLKASSKIVRFKLNEGGTATSDLSASTNLATLIATDKVFDPYRGNELESGNGGITVEGVAILGDRLFAGFRGPVVGNKKREKQAIILSAKLSYFFGKEMFDLKKADAKSDLLTLGEDRGVRDLAPYNKGLFILAGPVTSDDGTYSAFWWDTKSDEAKHLADLPAYTNGKDGDDKKQYKPEAILPLDRDDKGVRVLIMMDSAKEGAPHEVRIPYPG